MRWFALIIAAVISTASATQANACSLRRNETFIPNPFSIEPEMDLSAIRPLVVVQSVEVFRADYSGTSCDGAAAIILWIWLETAETAEAQDFGVYLLDIDNGELGPILPIDPVIPDTREERLGPQGQLIGEVRVYFYESRESAAEPMVGDLVVFSVDSFNRIGPPTRIRIEDRPSLHRD